MTHDENENLPDDDAARLSPLFDGELPALEAAALRSRVAASADLQRAQARLEKLTSLSRAVLAAPAVSAAEWNARTERVLRECRRGTGQVRILSLRSTFIRYAVAAAALFAATLVLPLIGKGPSDEAPSDAGRIPIARTPGANDFEVLEAWNGGSDYYLWLDYPKEGSPDAVVIMVNKT